MFSIFSFGQKKNNEKYITWDDFTKNFGKEMVSAESVYSNMANSGLKDNCLTKMDFTFVSNKKENLQKLGEFLELHYQYKVFKIKKYGKLWEINGETNEIPITADNLLFWGLDMYKRGYEYDSKIEAYGGYFDQKNQKFPELDSTKFDFFYDKGLECYNNGNLSGALFNWSLVIIIDPNSHDAYYSRAIVKDELYTWKAALKDYDKAIEIAPDFINAYLNRGATKDDNGDYDGALLDYEKVLSFKNLRIEDKQKAYSNSGNTYLHLKQKEKACEYWKKASEIGDKYSEERLKEYCK